MADIPLRDARWWTQDNEKERARKIVDVAKQLWIAQRPQREDMKRALRLYGNFPYVGLGPRLFNKQNKAMGRALSFNVTMSVIDTYVSQLTKDAIKTTVQPIDADWETTQQCKMLEAGLDGIRVESHRQETTTMAAWDSAVFGTGIVRTIVDDDTDIERPRVGFDRVFPWDFLIDPLEALYGEPPTTYHVRWVDKYAVREDYPEFKDKLFGYTPDGFDDGGRTDMGQTLDLIPLVESHRRPRRNQPGRYALACGDILLVDQPFDKPRLPYERLVRKHPAMGYWGDSLALELEPIQTQINILLDKIMRSHHLLAAGYWLVDQGSDVISNQLTNQIGRIIRFKGRPPKLEAPNTVAMEVYQHLQTLYDKAFELPGVNQMMAQSRQPSGDYSGRARLVDAAIQSQRFKPSYEIFQGFNVKLDRQAITAAREISETHGDWTIEARTDEDVHKAIVWADADLEDHQYTVMLKPTNAMADDPQGLLETALEMFHEQLVDGPGAMRVLTQNQDWKALLKQNNASYNLTMKMATQILNHGKFQGPEAEMNLAESIKEFQAMKLNAIMDEAPQDRIDMLDRWLVLAEEKLKKAAPPPAPAQLPPAPAPIHRVQRIA